MRSPQNTKLREYMEEHYTKVTNRATTLINHKVHNSPRSLVRYKKRARGWPQVESPKPTKNPVVVLKIPESVIKQISPREMSIVSRLVDSASWRPAWTTQGMAWATKQATMQTKVDICHPEIILEEEAALLLPVAPVVEAEAEAETVAERLENDWCCERQNQS